MDEEREFEMEFRRAANRCAKREYASKELYAWLIAENVVNTIASAIIQKLIEEKYLDDLRFARAFVNDKIKFNKWGKGKIKWQLHEKVDNEICTNTLDDFDEEAYQEIVFQELQKKDKTLKKMEEYQRKQKLSAFAFSRGYEFEYVSKYLKHINLIDETNL